MGKYDDMLHLPHHRSAVRPPMPMQDRAAQFSPFAALTGYEAVIEEAAGAHLSAAEQEANGRTENLPSFP